MITIQKTFKGNCKGLLLLATSIFILASVVFAQENTISKISIASPTASSLGKYADIPVNYHTGIPDISIPLYTVKAGPLSLPVGLSYHSSGLKVQEASSWVGAGWALNAGGVITRTVRGGPDERGTNMGSSELKGHFSDYGYNNYLSGGGQQQDWTSFVNGYKDGEPDLFFFNFAGHTGKFYFRDDRTPVVVPDQDLRIEYYYPGDTMTSYSSRTSLNIQAFTITTSDGVKYYFGNTPGYSGTTPIEVTSTVTDKTGGSSSEVISSWYLNKITSADGQFSINLSYTAESYAYFTTGMFPLESTSTDYEYNLVKNIVSGVRLNQVSFPGGAVSFNGGDIRTDLSSGLSVTTDTTNSSARTLGSVQISDGAVFCKKYKFYYGYFYDGSTSLTGYFYSSGYNSNINSDRYRLRLDSIQEISCDSSILIKPYVFSYYTEQVPRILSFGIDHWGFINGANTNNKLIPTYQVYDGTTYTTVTGANRDAAWPSMRAGSLNKITYPTGGYTQFDFEPNDIYTSRSVTELTTRLGQSIGFDGGAITTTSSLTADGNTIQLSLNNASGVYDAQLIIRDAGNSIVYNSGYVSSGSSYQTNLSLSSGTYSVTLSIATGGNSNPSGHGVISNFSQWVTSTVTGNTTIGGLRIKSVTQHDGVTSADKVTNYGYTNTGGQSTGLLYSKPVYVQMLRNDLIRDQGYYVSGYSFTPQSYGQNGCVAVGLFFKSPSTIRPMANSQGNHVGYSQVKVSQSGNGYSVYNYYPDNTSTYNSYGNTGVAVTSVTTNFCDPSIPNYPAAPLPFDSRRGDLQYEQHYDQSNNLVKDCYYYPVYVQQTDSAAQTPGFSLTTLTVSGVTKYLGTFYTLSNYHKSSLTTVATDYASGSNLTAWSRTEYNSPFHHDISSKVVVNSLGDSLISKMNYAFDFRISTCDSISNGAASYASACNSCLSTYNSSRSSCGTDASCLSSAYLTYEQCLTDARVSYVNLRKNNFTAPGNVFDSHHASAKSAADGELKPILQLQDQYENALIESTSWKNTNLLSASFMHYDYMSSPSGYVYPQKERKVELLSPVTSFTPATTSSNDQSITADSRYSDYTSFAFNAGNLGHVTARDGVPEGYLWDYNNVYPIAKTENATEAEMSYTSFEADGTGNWDFASGRIHTDLGSVTGDKSFQLSGSYHVQRTALDPSRNYLLTYWRKVDGGSVSVNSGSGGTAIITKNGWTLYQLDFTGSSSMDITGTSAIDELRLIPKNSQMSTFTYHPLTGITSQCDPNNRVTYYEYDALGRLIRVRDQDQNILKSFQYTYQEAQ